MNEWIFRRKKLFMTILFMNETLKEFIAKVIPRETYELCWILICYESNLA